MFWFLHNFSMMLPSIRWNCALLWCRDGGFRPTDAEEQDALNRLLSLLPSQRRLLLHGDAGVFLVYVFLYARNIHVVYAIINSCRITAVLHWNFGFHESTHAKNKSDHPTCTSLGRWGPTILWHRDPVTGQLKTMEAALTASPARLSHGFKSVYLLITGAVRKSSVSLTHFGILILLILTWFLDTISHTAIERFQRLF